MSSRYDNIQANVLRILEPAALGDRASRIWDLSLFGLVVLNLVAVALESVPAFQMSYGNWLYNAGIGNDSMPFRMFNPSLQSERYDPDNVYEKTWLND